MLMMLHALFGRKAAPAVDGRGSLLSSGTCVTIGATTCHETAAEHVLHKAWLSDTNGLWPVENDHLNNLDRRVQRVDHHKWWVEDSRRPHVAQATVSECHGNTSRALPSKEYTICINSCPHDLNLLRSVSANSPGNMGQTLTPVEYYALVVVAAIVLLACSRMGNLCRKLLRCGRARLGRYLCLAHSIPHMDWLGSWTWWAVLAQLVTMGATLVLIFVRALDIQSAARRAGEVAVVDMTLFYLGPRLSYQADRLNLSLSHIHTIHRGTTWLFLVATAIHAIVLRPTQPVFTRTASRDLYGVIVCDKCRGARGARGAHRAGLC